MENHRTTKALLKQVIPAVAAWAIGKALEYPEVKQRIAHVDRKVHRAGRNAKRHPALLAAGAAAMLIGAGLMARSTRRK